MGVESQLHGVFVPKLPLYPFIVQSLLSELTGYLQSLLLQKAKSKEMAETIESIISKISDRYKQKDDIEHTRKAREFLANNRYGINCFLIIV